MTRTWVWSQAPLKGGSGRGGGSDTNTREAEARDRTQVGRPRGAYLPTKTFYG